MPLPKSWANPQTTRSRVVLEIAAELVSTSYSGAAQARFIEANVALRERGRDGEPPVNLFASSTIEGIAAVVTHQAALAIVNPSTALKIAFLGSGPFGAPQPVRTIAVLPSADQLVFAVKPETELMTFEEIGTKRYPLKATTRGTRDHSLHFMLDGVAAAAGFSFADLRSWGGELRREGPFPEVTGPKVQALARGELEAMFEEGSDEWLPVALDAGMRILPLSEATVQTLEAVGYRRAIISRTRYPKLPSDILTVSFSGWPIFVHAAAPDLLVTEICAALDARKHLIPWQGDGPLPVERMCVDSDATPLDVPLHRAAERFWRARGYLSEPDQEKSRAGA